jgi:hypothetical protein
MTPPDVLIGFGQVRHTRLRPVRHAFAYPSCFLMLPMRSLRMQPSRILARNRFALLSFDDRDHGDGRIDSLAWLEELLASEGIQDARGEVWLHTYPRMLGYAFKPVSFWYCHRADDSLAAIVVEVNNTFGERHCYFLAGPLLAYGVELQAHKVFHVSPFCAVQGRYRFRFLRTAPDAAVHPNRTVVRIDHDDAQGPLLQTSVSGELQPLTHAAVRRAFLGTSVTSLGLIARIHWQALKLWLRRVPFFSKPEVPEAFVSR